MDRALYISIREAAERLEVSTSTVRNWIKTGVLDERSVDGAIATVTLESIERCEREYLGQGRLVSRANKQRKASPMPQVQKQRRLLDATRYDESLSESYRNREGVYYTPQSVARDLLSVVQGVDLSDKLLLDPCCGSGNFLVEAIEMGFRPENIYGYDIDPQAVRIARQRVLELTGVRCRNIICGDFLRSAQQLNRRFDYCVTNPPWGKKMGAKERGELTKSYGLERGADSSSMFLVATMGVLREGGVLSFLLQEAFFNVRSYESVRRYLFEHEVTRLVDHGQVFPSLYTRALSITLTKSPAAEGSMILCQVGRESYLRSRASFRCNPYHIINMWASPSDVELIERLFAMPYITLKKSARWGLGVVTGNNRQYTSTTPREGYVEVIRGSDIRQNGEVRRGALYLDSDLSKYQQVAPREFYAHPEKLIYRFISKRLRFALDREQLLILNSANMLILDEGFPVSSQQLVDLFNSDFMNWLYRTIFHTHKVLRGDLEQLPIFAEYFTKHKEFNEADYREWLNNYQ